MKTCHILKESTYDDKWMDEVYLEKGRKVMYENWYALQVTRGHEQKVAEQCESLIPKDILERCFVPKVRLMKKFKKKWQYVDEILFSGYLFLISDHIEELYAYLKRIPEFTYLLGNDGTYIYPLYKEEVIFLLKYDRDHDMVDFSEGYIEGDTIRIINGPLMGYEGLIRKIDRHKRLAFLEVELLGQITTIKVGLEIISKV